MTVEEAQTRSGDNVEVATEHGGTNGRTMKSGQPNKTGTVNLV